MPKPKITELMRADQRNVEKIVSSLEEVMNMVMSGNPSFSKADALVACVWFTERVTNNVIERGMIPKEDQYVVKRAVSDSIYLRLGV